MGLKLSLLMASYNNARYIRQAIESVLKQSSRDWELLIVDDCSTDNSLGVIRHYLKDKRIRLVRHKRNQGYGAALRTAVENSSGEIIGIIDADDALHKDAVKTMIKAHEDNPGYGLIYSTMYMCNDRLNVTGICDYIGKTDEKETNLNRRRISHLKTFKREAYDKTEGFDPKQKKAVDKDIIYKLEEVTDLKFIDKPLYYYRNHDKGISQGKGVIKARLYKIRAKEKANLRREGTSIKKCSNKSLSEDLYLLGYLYLSEHDHKNAKKFFIKSIKEYPLNFKCIKTYIKRVILRSLF